MNFAWADSNKKPIADLKFNANQIPKLEGVENGEAADIAVGSEWMDLRLEINFTDKTYRLYVLKNGVKTPFTGRDEAYPFKDSSAANLGFCGNRALGVNKWKGGLGIDNVYVYAEKKKFFRD